MWALTQLFQRLSRSGVFSKRVRFSFFSPPLQSREDLGLSQNDKTQNPKQSLDQNSEEITARRGRILNWRRERIGVTMEDDRSNNHDLDLERADRPVWLMKCPVVVGKAWQKLAPSSSSSYSSSSEAINLSKVVLSVDPLRANSSSPEFTMEMNGAEYGNMPKCYALNMFKDFVPMQTFSDVNQGNPAVEGKIDHKFDMKPHGEDIEEYARLCRERTSRSMVKNRQIQVIDNDRGVHMRPMPGMLGLVSSNSKEKKKPAPVKQTEVKRTRRDRGELEAIMFKLFEGQPNWTLKQLVQETDQPAQFLKEILNELCVYNKRGSNQGTYELKPEYKKSAEDDTGGQ